MMCILVPTGLQTKTLHWELVKNKIFKVETGQCDKPQNTVICIFLPLFGNGL